MTVHNQPPGERDPPDPRPREWDERWEGDWDDDRDDDWDEQLDPDPFDPIPWDDVGLDVDDEEPGLSPGDVWPERADEET